MISIKPHLHRFTSKFKTTKHFWPVELILELLRKKAEVKHAMREGGRRRVNTCSGSLSALTAVQDMSTILISNVTTLWTASTRGWLLSCSRFPDTTDLGQRNSKKRCKAGSGVLTNRPPTGCRNILGRDYRILPNVVEETEYGLSKAFIA